MTSPEAFGVCSLSPQMWFWGMTASAWSPPGLRSLSRARSGRRVGQERAVLRKWQDVRSGQDRFRPLVDTTSTEAYLAF